MLKNALSITSINDRPFFCSWSGGKDSCLALYHAIQNGGIPRALFTMMTEPGDRSRSHGLPAKLINCQAASLDIPQIMRGAAWETYEAVFLDKMRELKDDGIECGVFGDIDLAGHLEWVERVCQSAGIRPYEPLWQRERKGLLQEFLDLGFKAMIVSVKDDLLSRDFLGRILDAQVIAEMENIGIDASGEEGEYHTVVVDGPIFKCPLHLNQKEKVPISGYCFLDVAVNGSHQKGLPDPW
ncbi:MAG: diphthine--ammonia ligase [Desulfobacterales bacterium]